MAAAMKKPCVKCEKGGGVTSCDGCLQSFCIKHIVEHRQELAVEFDTLAQEHDVFRRDLIQDNLTHPLFVRINEWEQESVTKIRVAAEAARADLRELLDGIKTDLKKSVGQIAADMQSCHELEDYTEADLIKWKKRLNNLHNILETSIKIEIIDDESPASSLFMIKVVECSKEIDTPVEDRFRNFVGRISLSENGLLATCLGTYWDGSNIYGTRLYSSGRHEIHFRIDNKGSNNLFFGIKTTSHYIPVQTLTSSHSHGWWEFDQAVESIDGFPVHNDRNLRTGDEVTMVLDCDNKQIKLQHHRINMMTHLDVDPEKCSLPWKILVTLRSTGDSVRMLS